MVNGHVNSIYTFAKVLWFHLVPSKFIPFNFENRELHKLANIMVFKYNQSFVIYLGILNIDLNLFYYIIHDIMHSINMVLMSVYI